MGSWHFGRRAASFLAPTARVALLLADGSAGVHGTSDSNQGWQPNQPQSPNPTVLQYFPSAWEPPTSKGPIVDIVVGRYRWTRDGIGGRDFGGPEVTP